MRNGFTSNCEMRLATSVFLLVSEVAIEEKIGDELYDKRVAKLRQGFIRGLRIVRTRNLLILICSWKVCRSYYLCIAFRFQKALPSSCLLSSLTCCFTPVTCRILCIHRNVISSPKGWESQDSQWPLQWRKVPSLLLQHVWQNDWKSYNLSAYSWSRHGSLVKKWRTVHQTRMALRERYCLWK